MSLGSRINEIRKEKNMTVDELSARSGVPKGTLSKITADITSNPTLDTVKAIANALGCHLDDLDDNPRHKKSRDPKGASVVQISPSLSEDALQVARDYSELDKSGQRAVKVLIADQQVRIKEEKKKKRSKKFEETEFEGQETARVIPHYFTPAAAGYASPDFGEDFEYLEVGGDVPPHADYAVDIQGDSMEPYIMDGSTVYVNRDPLQSGDVGIFFCDGDMLCKQYYKDEWGGVWLFSLNRERADADRFIDPDGDLTLVCHGRVILPHPLKLAVPEDELL